MTTTIHHSLHSRADAGAVNDTTDPDPEVPERAKRRTYSARYKLDILTMYDTADRAGRGALLRREGLYTSHIAEWRKQRDRGAFEALSQKKRGRTGTDPREREVAQLRRKIERLEGDLSKARKVIEVQGKLSALLEELASESADQDSEQRR
jgi:hypothetical protein